LEVIQAAGRFLRADVECWRLLGLLYFVAVQQDRAMSRSVGTHTADPCPRCFVEAVHPVRPVTVAGCEAVGYLCDHCAHAWTRPVETDVEVYDVVRVDLPHATLYGTAWKVETDRIQVRGTGGDWLLWVERWRVIVY
jgi:hypothetical protein